MEKNVKDKHGKQEHEANMTWYPQLLHIPNGSLGEEEGAGNGVGAGERVGA